MDIKEYVERIVDNGNVQDMHKLSEILEDILETLKDYDKNHYKKYEMELYKMAYGTNLSRPLAEKIVSKMKPYRMRWSLDETRRLQEQYGIDNIRDVDFFVVINSAYNDYKDIFDEDTELYIKFTLDFINDEDAKEGKVFTYFTQIAE